MFIISRLQRIKFESKLSNIELKSAKADRGYNDEKFLLFLCSMTNYKESGRNGCFLPLSYSRIVITDILV